ncbi:hypothetical protein KBC55_01210 [Patescibacteria group bacterium]|nr:hypothetical protein [Patescibacteria group bacterium]
MIRFGRYKIGGGIMTTLLMRFRGVITDVDGTLIDSERGKMHAHRLTVEHFGGVWHDRLYLQFLGQSGLEVSAGIVRAAQLDCLPTEYREEYLQVKRAMSGKPLIHPWVPNLLRGFAEYTALPIAFVSSGYTTIELKTLIADLLYDADVSPKGRVILCGSDDPRVPEGRKTAHGIRQIVRDLGLDTATDLCLGLEDSLEGLRVLEAADIGTIIFVEHFANRGLPLSDDWISMRKRYVIPATGSWGELRRKLRI